MNKRVEATIEGWKKLYECATIIKEIEPWNDFWDTDLISLQFSEDEEPVFISILGKGGSCYGISCYLGLSGLNDFIMLIQQDGLGLTTEYAMFNQNNLTCYWGNRDELSKMQYDIVKQLGYKYRGNNNWLYFQSFKAGYFPYNFDKEEVQLMTIYFEKLIEAVNYYRKNNIEVNFDNFETFHFYYDSKSKEWKGKAMKLPFVDHSFSGLKIDDKQLIMNLGNTKRSNSTLEVELVYLGVSVNDKEYERPVNPHMYMIADHNQGLMMKFQMTQPDEDAGIALAGELINYIIQHGAPKKILFRSLIVGALLSDICDICNIKIQRVGTLDVVDNFIYEFKRYRR